MTKEELTKQEELIIFKNVNSFNKKYQSDHQNFIQSNQERDALRNQGVSRAKLREFVSKGEVHYEFWKNI